VIYMQDINLRTDTASARKIWTWEPEIFVWGPLNLEPGMGGNAQFRLFGMQEKSQICNLP